MRYRFLFLPLSILIISSCKQSGPPAGAGGPAPAAVDVMIAGMDTVPQDIEVNGTVLAQESVELRPETSGRIIALEMEDGAVVSKGALLARVNDAELRAQLRQQEVQLELAQKNLARLNQLLSINGVNQADIDAATSQVASLDAAVKVTQAQLDKTEIRAPFAGRLGLRQVSPGAYVTPATLLTTLQATGRIKVDFAVPETYGRNLKKGMSVFLEDMNGNSSTASVSAIEPLVNANTRNIKVRAVLQGNDLVPGSFVKVRLRQSADGILVPTASIIPDALSSKVVLVREGKGKFVNVKTGVRTADFVEITEGLTPGDSVVVTGVLFVRPNAPVKVRGVRTRSSFTAS